MSACTFFGHRDCPEFIYPQLVYFIRELVLNNNVRHFYVGTQGNFDNLAYRALKELQDTFQEVIVFRVLAYKPRGNSIPDSMLPEYHNPLFDCAFHIGIEPRKNGKRFFAPIVGITVRHNLRAADAEK